MNHRTLLKLAREKCLICKSSGTVCDSCKIGHPCNCNWATIQISCFECQRVAALLYRITQAERDKFFESFVVHVSPPDRDILIEVGTDLDDGDGFHRISPVLKMKVRGAMILDASRRS